MNPTLAALAGQQAGAFAATQAYSRGVTDVELRRAVAAGEVVRVRRGAYVDGRAWDAADVAGRFRLGALAVARTRPPDALSHHAALAAHDLPLWQFDADRIDLVTDIEQAVARGGIHLHPRGGWATEVVAGVPVVAVAGAVVRTALTMGLECAVVAGDAALHSRVVTLEQLRAEAARVSPHEGRKRAQGAIDLMDAASESVGESRTRLVVQRLGLAYESQKVLTDAHGRFVARVDFLVEGVVLEFDGRVKYLRDRRGDGRGDAAGGGEDVARVVWLEKRREDGIRRLGYPVERVVWDELDRPGLIGARLRAARANGPSAA